MLNQKQEQKFIKHRIIVSDEASYDVDRIENYIMYKLKNPIVAHSIVNGIIRRILILKQFPYIGIIYNSNYSNIRYLIYKNYLIFYEIREKENLIIIKTILHSRQNRDIEEYL